MAQGGPATRRDERAAAARRASGGAPGNRAGDARTHLVLVPALAVGSPLALVRVVGRSLLRALRRRGRRARREPQRAAPAQHFFERGSHGLRRPLDGRPLHVALLGDGLCEQVELLLLLEELRLLRGKELSVLLRLVLVMILLLGQLRCKVLGLLGHLLLGLLLLLLLLLLVQLVLRGRGGRRGLVLQRRQLGHGRRRAQLHLGLLLVLLLRRRLLLRAVLVHCDEQQAVARPAAHRDRLGALRRRDVHLEQGVAVAAVDVKRRLLLRAPQPRPSLRGRVLGRVLLAGNALLIAGGHGHGIRGCGGGVCGCGCGFGSSDGAAAVHGRSCGGPGTPSRPLGDVGEGVSLRRRHGRAPRGAPPDPTHPTRPPCAPGLGALSGAPLFSRAHCGGASAP